MSITFPEFTLGMPRIRLQQRMRFTQPGQMRLQEATAPYVANPNMAYPTGMVMQQQGLMMQPPMVGGGAVASRGASSVGNTENARQDQGDPKSDQEKKEAAPQQPHSAADPSSDLESRIDRLERCLERQCQTIEACVETLRSQRPCPPQPMPSQPPSCTTRPTGYAPQGEIYPQQEVPPPHALPGYVVSGPAPTLPGGAPRWQQLPGVTPEPLIHRASYYERNVEPRAVLRPLPPTAY
jgi:hypothetical protein